MSKNLKRTLVVLVLLILICSIVVYIAIIFWPTGQLFELYILGENKGTRTKDYYPNGNSTIRIETQVKWFIGVSNHMGSTQYVIVKVKLGNLTLASPERTEPAPIPSFLEFNKVLSESEVWEFRFFWFIKNIKVVGNMTYITNLTINDETMTVSDIGANYGYDFRLIFEL